MQCLNENENLVINATVNDTNFTFNWANWNLTTFCWSCAFMQHYLWNLMDVLFYWVTLGDNLLTKEQNANFIFFLSNVWTFFSATLLLLQFISASYENIPCLQNYAFSLAFQKKDFNFGNGNFSEGHFLFSNMHVLVIAKIQKCKIKWKSFVNLCHFVSDVKNVSWVNILKWHTHTHTQK
jgi:hypothetical protein